MDDPFASIISECMIQSEVEDTLPYAPVISKPCFFSGICSLDGQDLSTAPNPLTSSDIRKLPDSPSKPLDKEGLRDILAGNRSSSMPPPHLRLDDFTTLIKYFSQNADKSLGRHAFFMTFLKSLKERVFPFLHSSGSALVATKRCRIYWVF